MFIISWHKVTNFKQNNVVSLKINILFYKTEFFYTFVDMIRGITHNIFKFFLLAVCILSVANARGKNIANADSLLKSGEKDYYNELYSDAVDKFLKCITIARNDGDAYHEAYALCEVGMVYVRLNDYQRAVFYLQKGYELAQKSGCREVEGKAAAHLCGVYAFNDKLDEARKYYAIEQKLPHINEGLRQYFLLYNNGLITQLSGNLDEALRIHEQTLRCVERYRLNEHYASSVYGLIVYIYLDKGDIDTAKAYCEKYRKVIGSSGRVFMEAYYEMLRDVYARIGNKAMATNYERKADSISVAIITQQQINAVDNKVVQFEDEQSQNTITELSNKVNHRDVVIALTVAVIVMLILLALIIIRSNRKLKGTQRILIKKNQEIRLEAQNYRKLLDRDKKSSEHGIIEKENGSKHELIEKNEVSIENKGNQQPLMSEEQTRQLAAEIATVMNDTEAICSPSFSLAVLAQMVESNTTYVSYAINKVYNYNFKTLLNEYRIREACRRLEDQKNYGHLTIKAIFQGLGYSSYSNFVAAFKKVNGMTPSEYMRLARSK